jgi:type IV secretory pathway protease TraF
MPFGHTALCRRDGFTPALGFGPVLFLMNWDEPASLDGRYLGPIPLNAIVGRVAPLWTFEEN